MRIAFFSENFGNASFLCNQAELVAQAHDVKYFTTERFNEDRFPFPQVSIIPYRNEGLVNFIKLRMQWRDIKLDFYRPDFSEALTREIEAFRPDLIHCQFGWEALILFHNYKVPADIPVIIQFRGFDASQKLQAKSYVKALKKVMVLPNVYPVFVAEHLKANLELAGISFGNSTILHSNTDLDFFKRTTSREGKPLTFVQVSSFREKKGHKYTFNAFALLKEKNPKLQWILKVTGAEGADRIKWESMAHELGIHNHVEFVGDLPPTGVRKLLDDADVGVLHSVTTTSGDQEGIPNALMEAMAMELPVVSTIHAGIPELVEDGVHGRLVGERDVEAYAQALMEVSTWGLKPENRERVAESFSKEQHQRTLFDIYSKLCRASN